MLDELRQLTFNIEDMKIVEKPGDIELNKYELLLLNSEVINYLKP